LILVDHGSRDESVAIAEKWRAKLPIFIVRSPTNHSFSYSCNRAAEQASGEIIVLLNNDVVFCEDVIARMVDRLEADGGLVGIRLFDSALEREAGRPGHIGVRPCWNPGHRVVGGFNSRQLAGDGLIGRQPARMPAVTGAMLMCRQADYLRLGGLPEEYLYGYEDVDFCQKARIGAGLPITCMNDLAALHREGATRFAVIGWSVRRTWHRRNIATFNRRYGYALRREMMMALFSDDGSFLGRRPNVAITAPAADRQRFIALVSGLTEGLGWQVRWLEAGFDGFDLKGTDLLIVADPAYPLAKTRHRHPMLASVAWIGADPHLIRPDLACFDLVFSSETHGDLGFAVTRLDPAAPHAAAALASALWDFWSSRHRFCVLADRRTSPLAEALAGRLRSAGHHARVSNKAWRARDGMRDDVVLHLSTDHRQIVPARINLGLSTGPEDTVSAMDALLPIAEPDVLSVAIIAQADRCRAIRIKAPEDPPLPRATSAISASSNGWRSHPDPTYPLLLASKRG
jgi:GT2 family glycosyltransferase